MLRRKFIISLTLIVTLAYGSFVSIGNATTTATKLQPDSQPLAQQAHAAQPKPQFGLTMHGQPKHSEADTHFSYANPDAPIGGHLHQSAIGSFDTLTSYTIKGKSAAGLGMTIDSLMARNWDEPFTMYPLIAKSYRIAPDRSWIEFKLDPAARFHDGSPITVDDVIFSFETLKTYGRPNMRRIYKMVEEYKKIETDRIKFKFNNQHDQETALILAMMPVLSKQYWRNKTFDKTSLTPQLASGPYKVKDFEVGRHITYERAPNYWAQNKLARKGHNNFNLLTYHYFRDDNVALEAFKSGQLNLRHEPNIARWQKAYDIPAVKRGDITKAEIPHKRPEKTRGLIFNTRRDIFTSPKVREALSLMFDEDWINKNLFYSAYKRINSYYPNSELSANHVRLPNAAKDKNKDSRRAYARRSIELLKEAGWVIDNGILVNQDTKQPFTFEILLSNPQDEKLALHYIRSLKRLGISARVNMMDSSAYLSRLTTYDYDMTLYHWQSSLSPGTEQLLYYGCEAAKQPARWNYPGICDPEIDRLADSIARSKDREELVSIVRQLDQRLMDGHYMIPLFYKGADNYAYWRPVTKTKQTPLYGAVIESWWMAVDE